jgi:pimeloyl-ACP methyl ester carboxylesterase
VKIERFGKWRVLTLLSAAVLAACGGGSDDPPARGSVVSAQQAVVLTTTQIGAAAAAVQLDTLAGAPLCDVAVRSVVYQTRDPSGAAATASTAVMVPQGSNAACSGNRPVVLYAHGTAVDKNKNMADVVNDGEAALLLAMYAAQGMVVVAPNYLGYGSSSLSYHPYLNAEAQAVDMIDGLRAAKADLQAQAGTKLLPNKVLISGYSQGGHVAMATQRALERDHAAEFTVLAAGPMSGPYNLLKFNDAVVGPGPINAGATLFVPMLMTSYQKSYGNIYSQTSDVFQSAYAPTIEGLLPSTKSVATLIGEGKLPADPTFTALFGTGGLLTDSFRSTYATSNYRKAVQTNTLLGWTPKAGTVLCGGSLDPTVFFFNSTDASEDFLNRNAVVPAWDLETRSTMPAGTAFDAVVAGFAAAKTAAGANATAKYHGELVPPFCTALVRGYFQQVLAASTP